MTTNYTYFGVDGKFQFHDKSFDSKWLAETLFKKLHINAWASECAIREGKLAKVQPTILLVPDHFDAKRLDKYVLISFSAFLTLLPIPLSTLLLQEIGFSKAIARKYAQALPMFCLGSDFDYAGHKLNKELLHKLRLSMKKKGFHVNEVCRGESGFIGVGEKEESKKGTIGKKISWDQFIALQSHVSLEWIHKALKHYVDKTPLKPRLTGKNEVITVGLTKENKDGTTNQRVSQSVDFDAGEDLIVDLESFESDANGNPPEGWVTTSNIL